MTSVREGLGMSKGGYDKLLKKLHDCEAENLSLRKAVLHDGQEIQKLEDELPSQVEGDGWKTIDTAWNNSRVLAWMLVLAAMGLAVWATFCPRSPGVSIGLLALVAGVMSVRPKMHPAEKFTWVAVLIAFAILEVKAISKSDSDSAAKRKEDLEQFSAISESLKDTFNQTRPHAQLRIADFHSPQDNVYFAGKEYVWSFSYVNDGEQAGTLVKELAKIYVGKPFDEGDQRKLATQFEIDWNNSTVEDHKYVVPHSPGLWSIKRIFSNEEMGRLRKAETVYIFERLEYSDSIGTWLVDRCEGLQINDNKAISTRILRPCSVFTQARYPARPQ
jgi:hypothetical protein